MTNKERQSNLDKKKWLASERMGKDASGMMVYCEFCNEQSFFHNKCHATQAERESKCLCANAYNRFARGKK